MYDGLEQHAEGRWKIDQCPRCGVGLLNPRPTPAAIAHAYPMDYPPYNQAAARPTPTGGRERLSRRLQDARLASRWGYDLQAAPGWLALLSLSPSASRATDRLIRMAPAPYRGARLLDVGCSHGAYVALMSELGWEARGIEPDATAVERARREGLQVRQGTMIDLAPEVDGLYDHITIGHAIEHVHDPVASLTAVRSVLKVGGQLWIATPNLRSIGHRMFGANWRALDPPRHLVLFTFTGLREALISAGFRACHLVRPIATARWNFRESERVAGTKHSRRSAALAYLVNAITFVRIDLADELAVVATS
jgi:2-polyprenyl-3-methyl-5-hydroxy-6-metoxy-1,4-benzoquinol methylase